ncbi:MAG: hypothetical protein AB1806_13965 [Acidobacteriota bacterium]
MRRNLWAALARVERLAAEAEERATAVDPDELVRILLEGRNRVARGEPPRYSREELRERAQRLRAMF